MAIIDANLLFSDGQDATTSADSTNVIDLGVDFALGIGFPLKLLITPSSDFDGSISVALSGSDDNSTFETMITSKTYDQDALEALNRQIVLPVPFGAAQYLKLVYTFTDATAGTVTAGIVVDAAQYVAFPNGSVDDWEPSAASSGS